jgi:hypothetical protein
MNNLEERLSEYERKKQHYLNMLNIINTHIRYVKEEIKNKCNHNLIDKRDTCMPDETFIHCDKFGKTKL